MLVLSHSRNPDTLRRLYSSLCGGHNFDNTQKLSQVLIDERLVMETPKINTTDTTGFDNEDVFYDAQIDFDDTIQTPSAETNIALSDTDSDDEAQRTVSRLRLTASMQMLTLTLNTSANNVELRPLAALIFGRSKVWLVTERDRTMHVRGKLLHSNGNW